jgi:hypothetical protein
MSRPGARERLTRRHGRRWWGLAAGAVVLTAGLGAYALAGTGSGATRTTTQPAASSHRSASASTTLAPDGTFTTPSGATATIASLRGRPTMVWFVAGGCASCAVSIPAVASHLDQLTAAGLRVLTLGLYGDFSAGKKGAGQLLSFGRAATLGQNVERPGWEWGMASKSLSLAYDPSGVPDLYVLIGPTGHIRYRNSVPVSTMGQLLAEARRIDTHAQTTAAEQPCC